MSQIGSHHDEVDPRAAFENWLEDVPADPSTMVCCWRCAKTVSNAKGICPFCRASLSPARNLLPDAATAHPEATAVIRLIGVFAVLLLTSVVFGLLIRFGFSTEVTYKQQLKYMLGVEGVDTVLVLFAYFWLRPASPVSAPPTVRNGAWVTAFPLLAVLLGVNFAFHAFLRWFAQLPLPPSEAAEMSKTAWLTLLAVCIQPALIEELFFRRVALDTLHPVMGMHAAVLVSAVMFGMAHIGTPLSIPVLMLLGVALGYARLASNGLVLPTLMHFFHNLAVLGFEFCR